MPLGSSIVGKIGRTPIFGRASHRFQFGRTLLCYIGLAMAGTSLPEVVAQDVVIEPSFDDGSVVGSEIVSGEITVVDGTVLDDPTTYSEVGIAIEGGEGETKSSEEGVEPVPVDDGGPLILPYYRNLTPGGDPDLVDPLWYGGGLEPPFIYYMMSGGVFNLSSLAMSAQTSNQIAVATQLDALSGFTTPEIQSVIDDIGLLAPDEQRAAFDSLSGETFGTLSSIGLQIGQQSLRTVTNRLINNLAFLSGGGGVLLGQRQSAGTSMGGEQLVRGQSPVFGATGWMQGYGSSGSWGSNGVAAGADYRLGGFSYGADLAGDETGVFGISGGHSSTSLGTDRGDSGNVTSHQVGLYLLKNFDSFYGLGVFNYGHNSNKLTRLVTIGMTQQLVRSGLKSNQFGTYGEAGVNLDSEAVRIQPFFGLQYLSLTNGSAFEGPGGGVGLNIAGNSVDTLQTHLGARIILQPMQSRSGIEFRPYLNARWVADLLGADRTTTASFGGDPAGASWTVTGNHAGRNTGQAGFGFTAQVADGVSLFGNYDLQFGEHFFANTGSGGVLFEF